MHNFAYSLKDIESPHGIQVNIATPTSSLKFCLQNVYIIGQGMQSEGLLD